MSLNFFFDPESWKRYVARRHAAFHEAGIPQHPCSRCGTLTYACELFDPSGHPAALLPAGFTTRRERQRFARRPPVNLGEVRCHECGRAARQLMWRERRNRYQRERLGRRRAERAAEGVCAVCQGPLFEDAAAATRARSDRKTCSSKCRQAAYRLRKRTSVDQGVVSTDSMISKDGGSTHSTDTCNSPLAHSARIGHH